MKKNYQCVECGLYYKEEGWAKKCEIWCKKQHSCNLKITSHAIKKRKEEKTIS